MTHPAEPGTHPAATPPAGPGLRATLAVALALAVATRLMLGYQFGGWPQLDSLEFILRLSGRLRDDWYTSHPPPHWVFDHVFAWLPPAWLEPATLIGWWLGQLAFWSGFATLLGTLGVPPLAIVAAGIIGVPTPFAGFGASAMLSTSLHPSYLGDAGWLMAAAFALRGRSTAAAIALGAALLIHPRVGALALATVLPVLARTAGVGVALRSAGVALLIAAPALIQLGIALAGAERLPAAARFEIVAQVRTPHHLLYTAFPREEWLRVVLWGGLLAMALAFASRTAKSWPRGWHTLIAALAGACVLGAAVSWTRGPMPVLELHLARASNWTPLLAIAAAAAVLARDWGHAAAPRMLAAPALAALVAMAFARLVPASEALPKATLQAPGLALLLLAAAIRPHGPAAPGKARVSPRDWGIAFAVLLVALFVIQGWKRPPRFVVDADWILIAARAREASLPGERVLAPPDLDGFAFHSERAVVASFGEMAHHEVGEWRRRLIALTGRPELLAPDFPGTTADRGAAIGAAYDSLVFRGPELALAFRARLIVARRGLGPAPAWAESVAQSGRFALYRVRPEP